MKRVLITVLLSVVSLSVLIAMPVKNRNAADCIKRFFENHGTYFTDKGRKRITNATVECKDGYPVVRYWNSYKRQTDSVWAWLGSSGPNVKRACPVNPCR